MRSFINCLAHLHRSAPHRHGRKKVHNIVSLARWMSEMPVCIEVYAPLLMLTCAAFRTRNVCCVGPDIHTQSERLTSFSS